MSLKAYVYSNEELKKAGIEASAISFPTTLMRVTSPGIADAFFIPVEVGDVERRAQGRIGGVLPTLSRLPHWRKHERRHFFHMHSDEDGLIGTTAIVFRQSVNKNKKDPRTVAMPPPVEDFGRLVDANYDHLPYHVCFVGLGIDPRGIRQRCLQALQGVPLNCFLDAVGKHWCHYEGTPEGTRRRQLFVDALDQSRLVLSPRGAGQHSYRLFEGMSAGRVSILLGDDYELPFAEFIDYDSCIFRVPESQAGVIDAVILQINERCRPTPCMADMAARARQYWVRYLDRARWDEMILKYLEKLL